MIDLELARMVATNSGDIRDMMEGLIEEVERLRESRTSTLEETVDLDPGIEMVREFNVAYRYTFQTRDTPGIPDLGESGRSRLAWWASQLLELAAGLKREAAEMNAAGLNDVGVLLCRLNLSVEETGELAEALSQGDIVKAFDALLDMSYVNDGHYHTLGLANLKLLGYGVVHYCNMSKLGPGGEPIIDAAGRVVKGPNTRKPEEALAVLIAGG